MKTLFTLLLLVQAADYPVVYVRIPLDPAIRPRINDIENPVWSHPGSDLMLVKPDGTQEVLFAGGVTGGVLDPAVSLDGQWVYFSYQTDANEKLVGTNSPTNIYKINIATRQVIQLTHSEQTPITDDPATLVQTIHNVGACPIPGKRVIFESSRNKQRSTRDVDTRFFYDPLLQLYVMDDDGKNVEQVGYLNLGGSRHPTLMRDGRILWSSGEFHGLRSHKLWGLWLSEPDGRKWEPVWSAFDRGSTLSSLHWQSQTPNGNVQLVYYYPKQQSGYGNLFDFPSPSVFGDPNKDKNPVIADKSLPGLRFGFQPVGARSLTPFSSGKDQENKNVSHPSPAPDGLLISVADTSKGTINPSGGTMWARAGGIYRIPYAEGGVVSIPQTAKGAIVATTPETLIKVVDDPLYLETQARAVVPVEQIFGAPIPERPWIPNPTSTPFGYVGTSGVYARESAQMPYSVSPAPSSLWGQGGDVGTFSNSEIDKIRILIQRPSPKVAFENPSFPDKIKTWKVKGVERMSVLGEITVHKRDPQGNLIKDSTGDPDTSWLAKIPADHAFTFQLLDKHGQTLTHSFTWHQLRPGETRTDCRGCHAHHNAGIVFEGTAASKPDYQVTDLTVVKPKSVEWNKDVLPLLTAKCGECHGTVDPQAGLNLLSPTIRDSTWVKPFLARQSPIMQRVLSEDPTVRMPLGQTALSADEVRTLATWIDLGTPADAGTYYQDNQRPVLYVGSPQRTQLEVSKIQFGAFELDGTINNISVKATFSVSGRPIGAELFDLFSAPISSVWTLPITERPANGTVTVVVTDNAGRSAKIERTFHTPSPDELSQEQIAAIQAQIDLLNIQIATLQTEISSLNSQVAAKQTQVVSLQAQVAALEALLP